MSGWAHVKDTCVLPGAASKSVGLAGSVVGVVVTCKDGGPKSSVATPRFPKVPKVPNEAPGLLLCTDRSSNV